MSAPLAARKDESWYAMGIEPSVTKTPVGPVQVPVPYQVISDLSKAMGTSPNVTFNGQPAFLLDQSKMMKCTGDEQGTSGGVRSGMTSMEVKPVAGSKSVKINGKSAIRADDPCTLNKENCKGRFIKIKPPSKEPAASKNVKIGIIPSQQEACQEGPIAARAIVTPAGTPFEWAVSEPFELVDAMGNPLLSASETAHLRIKEQPAGTSNYAHGNLEAVVSVTASGAKGDVDETLFLPVHSGHSFGVKWDTTPQVPGEIVLATMESASSDRFSVSSGKETFKTQGLSAPAGAATPKLQLIVKSNAEGPNIVQAMQEKFNLMPGHAAKIRARFKDADFKLATRMLIAEGLDSYWAMELVCRVAMGYIAYHLSGDSSGIVADGLEKWQTDQIKESPCTFEYDNEVGLALVTVSGMQWKYDKTLAMERTCQYSFKVNKSVRIRNYTDRDLSIGGDLIQSSFSEVFDAIDPHAITAAVAISEGYRKHQKVYVVAHSQGSEICRAAFEFIQLMGKISEPQRRRIFTTDIINQVAKTILSVSLHALDDVVGSPAGAVPRKPVGSIVGQALSAALPFQQLERSLSDQKKDYTPPPIFNERLMGVVIDPEKIIFVGGEEHAERILNHTHYQGFGSETHIDQGAYQLGTANNSRTHLDPIPVAGETAKLTLAAFKIPWKVVLGAPASISSIPSAIKGVKKGAGVVTAKWFFVESAVKGSLRCAYIDAHDWFTNYWPNLRIPTEGNDCPTALAVLPKERWDEQNVTPLPGQICAQSTGGVSCDGHTGAPSIGSVKQQQQKAAVAVFIDGLGNTNISNSNIVQMSNAAYNFLEARSKDRVVTRNIYVDMPLSIPWDPDGAVAGMKCKLKRAHAYQEIIQRYIDILKSYGNYPQHIDLYGFGRGAAIASELAWQLLFRGLPGIRGFDKPNTVKVRFLGLFDTVHFMPSTGTVDSDNYWHEKEISPNVAFAAHALAGEESRVYFPPSMLAPRAHTKLFQHIFPGVHNDIGGHKIYDARNKITKSALKWMVKGAKEAGVDYFNELLASLEADPIDLAGSQPGRMDFPDGILDEDPSMDSPTMATVEIRSRLKKMLNSALDYPADKPFALSGEDERAKAVTKAINDKLLEREMMPGNHVRPVMFQKEPYNLFIRRVLPSNIPGWVAASQKGDK